MPHFVQFTILDETVYVAAEHVAQIREQREKRPGSGTYLRLVDSGTYPIEDTVANVAAKVQAAGSDNTLLAYQDERGNTGYVSVRLIRTVHVDKRGHTEIKFITTSNLASAIKTTTPVAEMLQRISNA